MSGAVIRITSISQLHEVMGLDKPMHPLITVTDAANIEIPDDGIGKRLMDDFYSVALKDKSCGMEYGRNSLDFSEGVLLFSAPGQVYTVTQAVKKGDISGWMMYFHPDLIRNSPLGDTIDDYGFFNYDVYEALHLSAEEERIIQETVQNIQYEINQRIDDLSGRVIVSNLELLLNYALRYFQRQFNTRAARYKDVVTAFHQELRRYFQDEEHVQQGIPSVSYFAEKANKSPHYFSDLIKKETGRSPKDHINARLIEKAKDLLVRTEQSVSEIAFELGFNYPHYFTRMFKAKTGHTPVEYRKLV